MRFRSNFILASCIEGSKDVILQLKYRKSQFKIRIKNYRSVEMKNNINNIN